MDVINIEDPVTLWILNILNSSKKLSRQKLMRELCETSRAVVRKNPAKVKDTLLILCEQEMIKLLDNEEGENYMIDDLGMITVDDFLQVHICKPINEQKINIPKNYEDTKIRKKYPNIFDDARDFIVSMTGNSVGHIKVELSLKMIDNVAFGLAVLKLVQSCS